MNLDEWMAQCTADLAKAEADLVKAQQKVEELRTIQEGVRLAQQRYGQPEQTPPPSPGRTSRAAGQRTRRKPKRVHTGYSTLCYDTLVELGGQSSTAKIHEVLTERGHDIDTEQVRNSFAYLVRKGQVTRVENGVWSLEPPTDPNPALTTRSDDPEAVHQPAL
jgi:hypothetical protein